MARVTLGLQGEDLVARQLASKGFIIIDRRWRSPFGEIDLVALERGEVVFIEVKTRRDDAFGSPEDAVTWQKRQHLRRVAVAYLSAHDWWHRPWRIDIAAVILPRTGTPRLTYFRSAVGED